MEGGGNPIDTASKPPVVQTAGGIASSWWCYDDDRCESVHCTYPDEVLDDGRLFLYTKTPPHVMLEADPNTRGKKCRQKKGSHS